MQGWTSTADEEETFLFLYKRKYSFITNIDAFEQKYLCKICNTLYLSTGSFIWSNKKVHNPLKEKLEEKRRKGVYYTPDSLRTKLLSMSHIGFLWYLTLSVVSNRFLQ